MYAFSTDASSVIHKLAMTRLLASDLEVTKIPNQQSKVIPLAPEIKKI
jgi:hypothetical protein